MLDVAQRGRGVFLGDGTFDSVPTMFKQLYTIHAEVDGSVFPVVFVLMEERSTEAYEYVFNVLKERGLVFKTFMTDFESASRKAARNVFGDVVVKGCWFHFTQAIMRRAKKIGLEGAYRTSAFVNATIRRLFGLPFVAMDEVEAALCAVENTLVQCPDECVRQKLLELMRYFRATWMNKYKPHEWNQVNDVVLRTNNWSEAFHAALSRRFVRAHPNVRVVVEALKNVEAQTRVAWNEFKCSPRIQKGHKDNSLASCARSSRRGSRDGQETISGFSMPCQRFPFFSSCGSKRSSWSSGARMCMDKETRSTQRSAG